MQFHEQLLSVGQRVRQELCGVCQRVVRPRRRNFVGSVQMVCIRQLRPWIRVGEHEQLGWRDGRDIFKRRCQVGRAHSAAERIS